MQFIHERGGIISAPDFVGKQNGRCPLYRVLPCGPRDHVQLEREYVQLGG